MAAGCRSIRSHLGWKPSLVAREKSGWGDAFPTHILTASSLPFPQESMAGPPLGAVNPAHCHHTATSSPLRVYTDMRFSWRSHISSDLKYYLLLKIILGASLVVQWLRICLPMQGTRVPAPVWEDPTCHGAAGPVSHNYWACASGACAPQKERPRWWEACAPRWRVVPTRRNWRKPSHRNEDSTQS